MKIVKATSHFGIICKDIDKSLDFSIGIMQGRLSNKREKTQSFPFESWREEFLEASSIGFNQIEWLVDEDSISKNPIATIEGRKEISDLMNMHKISVRSLCAHKFISGGLLSKGDEYVEAKNNLIQILKYASEVNIEFVILPVMNEMSIKSVDSKTRLKEVLYEVLENNNDIKILLECDIPAYELKVFMDNIGLKNVGILYDLGNATSLGYDIEHEIKLLHSYIGEIHIKDRFNDNGPSMRLGGADTSFNKVAKVLKELSWQGAFVLETPVFDNWKKEAEENFLFTKRFVNSIIQDN